MLLIAKAKLDREPLEVHNRIHLIQGDMGDFRLEERFNMVFIPLASFYHFHTHEKQFNCLSCMHSHLTDKCITIIDVLPAERMENQEVGKTAMVKRGINPDTENIIQELNKKLSIDKKLQCVTVEHTYIETEPDSSEKSFVFIQQYTWVTEDEMRQLLTEAGFSHIHIFGDYDSQPFSKDSPRMIFVARK